MIEQTYATLFVMVYSLLFVRALRAHLALAVSASTENIVTALTAGKQLSTTALATDSGAESQAMTATVPLSNIKAEWEEGPHPVNGRFCATVAFNDSMPFKPDVVRFKVCLDLKSGKAWELSRGRTSIMDGPYTTSLLPDGNCTAYPGDTDSYIGLYSHLLSVNQEATLVGTKGGNQTWEVATYKYWEGSNHTCTGFNAGERETTWWTFSETMTDGTYDMLEQGVRLEDCEGGKWRMAGANEKIYDFTADYTRDVDPGIFERPASYCYDPHPWVQSRHCQTHVHTKWGDRTFDGCSSTAVPNYDGCCAVSLAARPNCGEPKNCSSVIYGKAYP